MQLSKYFNIKISEVFNDLNPLPEGFDFYNIETKKFYKQSGKTLLRYSKHLDEWLLELNKFSIIYEANLDSQRVCEIMMVLHIHNDYTIAEHLEIMP